MHLLLSVSAVELWRGEERGGGLQQESGGRTKQPGK